jgi:hypothetical protein
MIRAGHEQVDFFIGTEVEHTPAFGLKTLFVVGIQDSTHTIKKAAQNGCTHIYFGANQSFPNPEVNNGDAWRPWETMISDCLQRGFLCTLDLDVKSVEGLVEGSLIEYNNFIPMISVKLPYLQMLGYNATIKLDDKDFAATNPGVWCHQLHDLRDRTKFTDWSKYTKDEIIK